jgi:hypothetical protein
MSLNKDVFFHEDDYCQIELLPIQNLLAKRNETDFTQDYSEHNLTENGFINITSRNQTIYPLHKLNISHDQFENILREDSLFYFDNVFTGYSTQRLLKKKIYGFGFENYIVYFETKNKIIVKSWIDYNILSDTLNIYPEKLQNSLLKLGELFNLILIDWNEFITIILKNKADLMEYIKEVL